MKALLDTNPLVSALLKPVGVNEQIFQRWRAGEFELPVSPLKGPLTAWIDHRSLILTMWSFIPSSPKK